MRENTKILCTDIDGVLNSFGDMHDNSWVQASDYTNWKKCCVTLLNQICFYTQCKVVISSSWRKLYPDINWWNEQFKLAMNPCPSFIKVVGITGSSHNGFRGREINEYLKTNPCDTYCILDDESDFYPNQHRVHTDMNRGLSKEDARKVIAILNGDKQLGIGLQCMQEYNPL